VFKQEDSLLDDNFVISEINDWKRFLSQDDKQPDLSRFRVHANNGRPLGDDGFIFRLEVATCIGRCINKNRGLRR
jgi:hypothetical protein